MINTILLIILALIGFGIIGIGINISKKLDSLKDGNNPLASDISLIDEVINYISSKGLEPTIGDSDSGKQYFAYIKDNVIMNIVPIEDIEYKKDSLAWKARRSELFKAIDKYLEENN
jgi:hypothetical protein